MSKKTSGAASLTPNIKILIQGKPISPEADADFVSAKVSEDLDAPSMFELRFVTWDVEKQQFTWIDRDIFELGNKVEIQMGHQKNLKTVIVGEITGFEPEFNQNETPILVVRGHDLRHRFLRGCQTKSFTQMKDSDIVSQIAKANGLTPTVEDTKVKLEYVLQHNQTDWEFLQERAARISYEIVVDDKTLYFRPHNNEKQKLFSLTYGEDLQDFLPRLSTMKQVYQVQVQGWLPKEKKTVIAKAESGKEGDKMGGSTAGAKEVKKAFGISSNTIVNQLVSSKAEAERIALGQFRDTSLEYISGEANCQGNPNLRAGIVIGIAGVGKRFSGLYYIVSVEHDYTEDEGYKTSFTVRRNAT
ncbi:phage late control D family protein [Nostoc sp. FACHB-152]|uniref:phage late control D family protein n=1 Tax=unclassified Nostoc TaxID=2593658 RepID=UPI00168277B6|nr:MULTISPECIES: contractile injection system protein, VgrG/Pvc8 family [unclassified Nostoc]MBD2449053.1 phage late control D family protein [Nostoc sp. FACHB-152]MBD2471043.1 phage late control D family protein [Nostoc sp. FACHB-145]